MLSFGNERVIQQGEDWTLDILLSQSSLEYIPFIVSSVRSAPMFVITVASAKYEKTQRYVVTYWLDPTELPKFYQTVPVYLGEIPWNTPISKPSEYGEMEALFQYTKAEDVIDPNLGHKPYYYVYFIGNEPTYGYECRLVAQFTSEETSKWESQDYLYQITLVDTISMADYINLAHDTYPTLKWMDWVEVTDPAWEKPTQELHESNEDYELRLQISWTAFRNEWILNNIEVLFTFIKARIPNWFQTDIEVDSPVGYVGASQVILTPTNLQVNSNLRKII